MQQSLNQQPLNRILEGARRLKKQCWESRTLPDAELVQKAFNKILYDPFSEDAYQRNGAELMKQLSEELSKDSNNKYVALNSLVLDLVDSSVNQVETTYDRFKRDIRYSLMIRFWNGEPCLKITSPNDQEVCSASTSHRQSMRSRSSRVVKQTSDMVDEFVKKWMHGQIEISLVKPMTDELNEKISRYNQTLEFQIYSLESLLINCLLAFPLLLLWKQLLDRQVKSLRNAHKSIIQVKEYYFAQFTKIIEEIQCQEEDIYIQEEIPEDEPGKIFRIPQPHEHLQKLIKLDLSSRSKNNQITPEGIEKLVKAKMPQLSEIDLKKNTIQDKGVQLLCKTSFKKLTSINLNDNGVTTRSMGALFKSKWNEEARVILDCVATSDNQRYKTHVGESVRIVKNIIKKQQSSLMSVFDELAEKEEKQFLNSCELFLETSLADNEEQERIDYQAYRAQLLQHSQANPQSIATVLLQIQQTLGPNIDFRFSKSSDAKSKVSSKILFGGLGHGRCKFSQSIPQSQHFCFGDFNNNSAKILLFQQWFKESKAKQYGVDPHDITIHSVSKDFDIVFSCSTWSCLNTEGTYISDPNVTFLPFFQALNLSPQEFDNRGDFCFPGMDRAEIQERGGLKYYQPVESKRKGIKVSGLYDDGSDDWLKMDCNANEWAVAFHGVNHPVALTKEKIPVLKSIMNSRQKGNMLIAGAGQAYRNNPAVNKPDQKIGVGIYCTPYLYTALDYCSYSTAGNQSFYVLMQCRVRTDAIKMTQRDDYWVINNSKDIRPYGIVILTKEQFTKIRAQGSHGAIYRNDQFSWNTSKNSYNQFRRKHGLSTI